MSTTIGSGRQASKLRHPAAVLLGRKLQRMRLEWALGRVLGILAVTVPLGVGILSAAGIAAAGAGPGLILAVVVGIAIAAVVPGVLGAPSLADTARRSDTEFDLKDRTRTALEMCESGRPPDDMTLLLVADASRRLSGSFGSRVFAVRRQFRAGIVLCLVLIGSSLAFDLLAGRKAEIAGGAAVGGPATTRAGVPSVEDDRRGASPGTPAIPAGPVQEPAEAEESGPAAAVARAPSGTADAAGPTVDRRASVEGEVRSAGERPDVESRAPAGAAARAGGPPAGETTAAAVAGTSAGFRNGAGDAAVSAGLAGSISEGAEGAGTAGAAPRVAVPDSAALTGDARTRPSADPRAAPGYAESWARAGSVPFDETTPPGMRRYIRDYFIAIRP